MSRTSSQTAHISGAGKTWGIRSSSRWVDSPLSTESYVSSQRTESRRETLLLVQAALSYILREAPASSTLVWPGARTQQQGDMAGPCLQLLVVRSVFTLKVTPTPPLAYYEADVQLYMWGVTRKNWTHCY